jgi:acyl carrier protein
MGAKCRGAWLLHRHTAQDPLRHFVLFSSISAMVGGTGQASYAMACSYLDGLARHRRARGLVATSLNWGALRDVGMATRYGDVERLLGSTGLGLFTPAQAVRLLALATAWQPIELGIAQMDWAQWARTYPTWGASPKYRDLLAAAPAAQATAAGTAGGALRARLLAASPEAREAEVGDRFAQLLAETLGGSAEAIDRSVPLPGLGLDSMMALDLLAALDTEFGVKVPMLMVMKGNSIEQLVPLVAAMIVESAATQAAPAAAPGTRHRDLPEELDLESVERFIAGLGDLDDGEIERLLQRVMHEEDATP